jgi:taspase, threonine aspartase, 1
METVDWFVAVHIGAGHYDKKNFEKYKKLMKKSCRAAALSLSNKKSSIEAITNSISILEDDDSTNAGFGSCLNIEGKVECDASIMSGEKKSFSAVGACVGVKNPIQLASFMLKDSETGCLPLGRIKPM